MSASGLVFAFALDGKGGGERLDLAGVRNWQAGDSTLWVHLDYTGEEASRWFREESGVDPVIANALMAEETRPRSLATRGGMLLILRGVNLNPGADPDDMVALRLWIDEHRIITLRHRRVMAVDDLQQAVVAGDGPTGPGDFLGDLTDRLTTRMSDVIAEVDDSVDALEDEMLGGQSYDLRQRIGEIRRSVIGMRRYLAPQRDVMARLYTEKVGWLNEAQRMRLREISDRTTRFVEDLDAIRDRASVSQEELNNRLAEQMNSTMYMLSMIAGLFLPLGFLTGLLGINIGGMPGTDSKWAFSIFCVALVILAGGQFWYFRRKRWI